MEKNYPSTLIGFLLAILLVREDFASGEIFFKKGSPHVKLSNNAFLSGSVDYSREGRPFHSFIGVPFGKVPERFQESQPVPAWEGVLNATKQGNVCVQPFPNPETGKIGVAGEEDCLNLNVYVPMNNTQEEGGFNVMLWVHGGGFTSWSGFYSGPKYLMDEDVILITINYRLGAFGFLSTGDSVIPGNQGMKDMVLALRWVQEHINNFGGDAKKVTVFGESAGGAAVHYLMLSPTTDGLFQKAISQSGSALGPWAYHPNPKPTAVLLAKYLDCPTTATEGSEISSEEIRWPSTSMPFPFSPVKEPKASSTKNTPFLTESPWSIIVDKSESLKEIPWMVGITKDEGLFMPGGQIIQSQNLTDELDSKFGTNILRATEYDRFVIPEDVESAGKKIRDFYFGDKSISPETKENLINIYTDSLFLYPVRKAALETASRGGKNPVYLYQYNHVSPVSLASLFGFPVEEEDKQKVGHAEELILQFNMESFMPAFDGVIKPDSEQEKFSKNFVKLWVSFAFHGKPKHSWGTSKEEWKPISKNELEGKVPLKWFQLTSNPSYVGDDAKKRAMFWETMNEDYFLDALRSVG